jgi:hypothetical protein
MNENMVCSLCGCLITGDEVYWLNDRPYCRDCYDEREDDSEYINDYYYKPRAKFHKCENEDCGEMVRINRVGNLDRYRFNFYNGDFNGFSYYGRCAYYDEEIEAMLSEPAVMRTCLDEARECLEGYF